RYAVYRQDNGLYGLVGETEETSFIDDNFAADLTVSPPAARNPFSSSGDFPACSGYYQQRQHYAATTNSPDTLFASQTGLRLNMSVSTPLQADDAITAALSAQDVQIIRHFIPLDDLIVLTNAGEWRINSGGDSSYSSDTIKLKPQEFWGSDHMAPIVMGKNIFYVEDGGGRVRSLGFSAQAQGYESSDMNLLSNHLLVEDGPDKYVVSDWTHQQFPEPRLYIVRSDGKILTMTFNQEQKVIAWTTWDTQGDYESITSLRRSLSSVEDGVYFIVKRLVGGNTVRFIERMHTRKFADVRDTFFLDAGAKFDSPVVITGITTADPSVFTAASHGFSDGDEVEIVGIEWVKDVDSLGNETNPDQFNDSRFTLANTTANTFELLKRSWGTGLGLDWDVSTFLPDTSFNLVNDVSGDPRTVEFSSDGLKMFILDDGGDSLILEFDLSQAYDIATAVNNGVSFDYSALTTAVRGMSFSGEDGTTLFLAGYDNDIAVIYELTLSSGFDLSTATDSGNSFDISGTVDEIFDIDADDSGTRLYVATRERLHRDVVFQFSLTGSDITTLAANKQLVPLTLHLRSVFVRKSGTQLFLLDDINGLSDDDTSALTFVYEYTLTTPYDIDTAVFQSRITLNQVSCAKGVFLEPDGGGYDIGFASYDGDTATGISTTINGFSILGDGTKCYVATTKSGTDFVHQFDLSTAYDISTAVDSGFSVDVNDDVDAPGDMAFRPDGTRFFLVDSSNDNIEQYSLSSAGNISSAVADSVNFDFTGESANVTGMWVNTAGTKMWLASNTVPASIFQYTLSTPWVVSSAAYDSKSLNVSAVDADPLGVSVNTDGTKLYWIGLNGGLFHQYTMSSANDISTAAADTTFDLSTNISAMSSPKGGVWKADGTRCYFAGSSDKNLYHINVAEEPSDRKLTITGGCESPAVWDFSLTKTTGDEGKDNTLTYLKGGEARVTTNIISGLVGLHCLNGETVCILADGNLEPDQTITNSTITIENGRKVARAAIGLCYTTDIETLNIEVPSPPGTIQDKRKKITDVLIRFYKSRMPFIGPNSSDMVEIKGREFEKYGEATQLLTGDRTINIPPSWNSNGRLFIRMRAPVPLTILGLFPNMVVEDSFE
ncbi:hypothetical protein LCGC14_1408520, partial [marine sediment metagenome]